MRALITIFIFGLFGCSTEYDDVTVPQHSIPTELMSEKESAMIYLINQHRVSELKTSLFLFNQAKEKVHQMAVDHVVSHSGYFQAAIQSGAVHYGQCISYNYVSAEANVQGFRTSTTGHWEIIMNPHYEYIAIACEDNYTVVLVASWRK